MVYRVAIVVLGVGYVAYRIALVVAISRAKRAGDSAREQWLRSHGFGLYRCAAALVAVLAVLLVLLVWSNSRG
jgi:hypothetical protein